MKEIITPIKFRGYQAELVVKSKPGSYGRSHSKHSVYVWSDLEPLEIYGMKEPEYSVKGENPELDKAWRKYNKAEQEIQRAIIQEALTLHPELFDNPEGLKWSRKAGCACGCSPGWKTSVKGMGPREVYITLRTPEKIAEREQSRADYKTAQEAKTLASMVI